METKWDKKRKRGCCWWQNYRGIIKRGERTAVVRGGEWEVTEAVGNAKVRTLCVGERRLGCLPGSRWASWRCPPWPSTGCADWGSTWRELPIDRGSDGHTAPPLQTAARQWPCGGSGRPLRASTQTLHTEPSTHPDDRLPLLRQMHWPPNDEKTWTVW